MRRVGRSLLLFFLNFQLGSEQWENEKREILKQRRLSNQQVPSASVQSSLQDKFINIFPSNDLRYDDRPMTITCRPSEILAINENVLKRGFGAERREYIRWTRGHFFTLWYV